MKPSEILRAAKRLIDSPDRWRQDAALPGDSLCVLNAIDKASNGEIYRNTLLIARIPLYTYMKKGIGGGFVGHWNDAPERTHADVMAAFDRAIALAEKDELPQKVRESDDAYTRRVLSEIIAAPVAEGVKV